MLNLRALTVLSLAFAMILIGINSQSGWLFWLAGLCIAAVAVSWVDSLAEVRKLVVERLVKGEAIEGETVEVALHVRNRGRLSRNLLLIVDEDPSCTAASGSFRPRRLRRGLRWPSERLAREVAAQAGTACGLAMLLLPRVEAGESVSLSYMRGGLRRGEYRDWPVYVYSEGILGLARHQVRLKVASHLIVLPRHAELRQLPALDSLPRAAWSLASISSRGGGTDFYGVREFQAGDPLRHVHWKSTARRGELVVREFEEEASMPVLVLIDNRHITGTTMREDSPLDIQARLAASIAGYAQLRGHPVTLAAYEGRGVLLHESQGLPDVLRWLAVLKPTGARSPREQAQGLRFMLTGGCTLFRLVFAGGLEEGPSGAELPLPCRTVLIIVSPAGAGEGESRQGRDKASRAFPRELPNDRPTGIWGLAVYREGDDIATCLENSFLA